MHRAAGFGYSGLLSDMIGRGAVVDPVIPKFEETPLFWATSEGRAEAAAVLIAKGGANVAHRDHKGKGESNST